MAPYKSSTVISHKANISARVCHISPSELLVQTATVRQVAKLRKTLWSAPGSDDYLGKKKHNTNISGRRSLAWLSIYRLSLQSERLPCWTGSPTMVSVKAQSIKLPVRFVSMLHVLNKPIHNTNRQIIQWVKMSQTHPRWRLDAGHQPAKVCSLLLLACNCGINRMPYCRLCILHADCGVVFLFFLRWSCHSIISQP